MELWKTLSEKNYVNRKIKHITWKFLDLRRHLENSKSTMHRNPIAHTACIYLMDSAIQLLNNGAWSQQVNSHQ